MEEIFGHAEPEAEKLQEEDGVLVSMGGRGEFAVLRRLTPLRDTTVLRETTNPSKTTTLKDLIMQ